MKQQQQTLQPSMASQQETYLLRRACRDAGEGLCRGIVRDYRRGSRRADLRHYTATLLVGLCLAVFTAMLTAWFYPYTMSGGDRQQRLAAYALTRNILMQS
jgi:hypothetical protein